MTIKFEGIIPAMVTPPNEKVEHPNIVDIKDSSGDLSLTCEMMRQSGGHLVAPSEVLFPATLLQPWGAEASV